MKRITIWTLSTVSSLVLLFSYHTSTNQVAASSGVTHAGASSSTGGTTSSGSSPATSSGTGASSGATSSPSSSGSTTSGTFTGDSVQMRYGPVQVKVTVSGGKVTAVEAVDYPMTNPRDQEINSQAIPTLNSEATSAGTSSIDMVSGATYTSDAYVQSLQSALDKAGV